VNRPVLERARQSLVLENAIGLIPAAAIILTGCGMIGLLTVTAQSLFSLATLTIALATILAASAIAFLQKCMTVHAELRIRKQIAKAAGISPKASLEALTSAIEARYFLAIENEARQIRDDKLLRALHSALEGERQAGADRLMSAIETERRAFDKQINALRDDFDRASKALSALGAGRTRVRLGEGARLAPEINVLSAKLRDLETRLVDSYYQLTGADLPESECGLFAQGEALTRHINTVGVRSDDDTLTSPGGAPEISDFAIRARQLTADLAADAASLVFVLEGPAHHGRVLTHSNHSGVSNIPKHQEHPFPQQLQAAAG